MRKSSRLAWLVFDIIGCLVYLNACCMWLIGWEQPTPTPVPMTVQEAR